MLVSILGTTLVDYPGRVASTLFFAGCNLRCPFCHNAELVFPELYAQTAPLRPDEVERFLVARKGFISGIVFTGGEPLLSDQLLEYNAMARDLGYVTKLDTNGTLPLKLESMVTMFDYIAMDIKAPPDKYEAATGRAGLLPEVERSINIIIENARDYEFRTTVVPTLLNHPNDFRLIGELVKGAKRFALQQFIAQKTLDEELTGVPAFTPARIKELALSLSPFVEEMILR